MLKNKSYIGISFIILLFGIYAVPKIIDRIENNDVVKGDRLDKVGLTTKNDDKLVKIGPAPKFELVNQDNIKITNETYKGKVYVLEFFFTTCPSICPKMNLSMLAIENSFFGNPSNVFLCGGFFTTGDNVVAPGGKYNASLSAAQSAAAAIQSASTPSTTQRRK